ncbi:MAG: T9SS type A sorting domain-containing protein [Bacteroidota bacterium]
MNVADGILDNGVSATAPISESRSLGLAPNPAQGLTAITVDFHKATRASFDLYSIDGQHLETLKQAKFTAGTHNVWVDASSLPAGVYFIRVDAEVGQFTEKLIVTK